MFLETKRLILKEFTTVDQEAFVGLMSNPEVMRFSLNNAPLSIEQAQRSFQERILDHYKKFGYGLMAIFLRESNDFIGFSGLISQTIDGCQEVELAYRLLPEFWNKGYATEAAVVVCEYAFNHLHLDRLVSIIDVQNEPSKKVACKIGMHEEKETVFHGKKVWIYALSRRMHGKCHYIY